MYTGYESILPSLLESDTLSPSDISVLIEKMSKKIQIEKKYGELIKERKDGRQFYIYINRKQISSTSKEELLDKLYELEYGKMNSSMSDIFNDFMCWKRDYTSTSPKTLREYFGIWSKNICDSEIVNIPLCNLTRKDFLNYFRLITKERKLTRKYFNNIKSVLNGIMAYAIEEEIISHNPIKDIDFKQFTFKPVNHQNDVFTIEDREKLLNYLEKDNSIYSLAIQFDFHMVLRVGELLALKWSDIEGDYIHVQRQRILSNTMNDDLTFTQKTYQNSEHVKGYTDKGFRYIPISPKANMILEKVRELNPTGEYIFMHEGRHLTTDTFNRKLKKYCSEINITENTSHKIRFSSASILFASGMPLTNLQALLGHTTPAMTMHYIRQVTPLETTSEIMCNALG